MNNINYTLTNITGPCRVVQTPEIDGLINSIRNELSRLTEQRIQLTSVANKLKSNFDPPQPEHDSYSKTPTVPSVVVSLASIQDQLVQENSNISTILDHFNSLV